MFQASLDNKTPTSKKNGLLLSKINLSFLKYCLISQCVKIITVKIYQSTLKMLPCQKIDLWHPIERLLKFHSSDRISFMRKTAKIN